MYVKKKKKGTGGNLLLDDIVCTFFDNLGSNRINFEINNSLSKTTVTNREIGK